MLLHFRGRGYVGYYEKRSGTGPPTADPWCAIHSAVISGLEKLVLSLLDEGFDVDARDGDGMTPLLWELRDAALTTLLMSNKAIDVNARSTTCGYTPLSIAARKGDQATVQLLLAREEIDVNVPETQVTRSHTALSITGTLNYPGMVELLLEREDTKADSRDEQGTTPLMKAAHRGNACIVKLLLARSDVDVLAVDDNGATPLSSAEERRMGGSENDHDSVIRLLHSAIEERIIS